MNKRLENTKKERLNEIRIMNCGEECEIVEYRNNKDITVRFINTGEVIKSSYKEFKNGNIRSHFTPTALGVGVVGINETVDGSGKHLNSYICWRDMLRRCYSEKYQEKHPAYIDCSVCKEWLYYPNFKKWYEENYYEVNGQRMELDKDILIKGNKVYSPKTCIIVPKNINTLFTKRKFLRGEFPIGASKHNVGLCDKFRSECYVFIKELNKYKRKLLGLYNTPEEAFGVYKKTKEENIKNIADYYKDQIPRRLYIAMYRYEVEITD